MSGSSHPQGSLRPKPTQYIQTGPAGTSPLDSVNKADLSRDSVSSASSGAAGSYIQGNDQAVVGGLRK
eukprot:2623065-Rhodomonas_salina.1